MFRLHPDPIPETETDRLHALYYKWQGARESALDRQKEKDKNLLFIGDWRDDLREWYIFLEKEMW